ncbi:hypothetical protein Asppvi_003426 [Aspergillus pseudoviridinutans]|uniref:Cytochrome P450 n=1 Tax=Aspergillus pseudoviridinutans TaxID=1517512 RepID=A0A9P3ER40_9EURO|nr:uncharacterized protein Asppvi_003426 [Aspergillus pseudoviridinutans]GIJ84579.1 hypothetical protein Asppvi_003426 [Aspergillus pseudoviridinutans]
MSLNNILSGIAFLLILRLLFEYHRGRKLPPGPRRLPLIGNIHQVPKDHPWRVYDQWSKKYGPLMSAQFGRQTMILIADANIARELLDKRGSIYSDRPRMVMAGENLTKGMHLLMRQYDERYRLHQRMEAPVLSPRASPTYFPLQDLESKQLLHDLLSSNDFCKHFERFSSSLGYSLAYGIRLPTGDEQDIQDLRRILHNFTYAARPGTWIIDAIPLLNHLPACLAPWKRTAEELFQLEAALHLKNMDIGLKRKSWNWTKEFAKTKQAQEMDKLEFAYDVGILTDAAYETTATVMRVFVLAALAYPSFIAKAQKELDDVVGPDRLPTLSDKENLPYIQALIEETLRWRSIVPGGVPHASAKEDTYLGYEIPKGATIVALHWSMSMHEGHFENPMEFHPERWLNSEPEGRFTNFFGPKAIDDMAFNSGFVSVPDPFAALFVPRSERAKIVIEKEWEDTEKDLNVLMDSIREQQRSIGLDFVPKALREFSTDPEDPPFLYYLVESKDCPSTREGFRTRLQDGESFESDFINASKEECQKWALDKWLQPIKFNFIEQSIIAIADERSAQDGTLLMSFYFGEDAPDEPPMEFNGYGPLPPKGNTWYDFRIHHNAAQLFHASVLFTEPDILFPNYFGRPDKFTDETGVFDVLKAWKHTEESSDKDG